MGHRKRAMFFAAITHRASTTDEFGAIFQDVLYHTTQILSSPADLKSCVYSTCCSEACIALQQKESYIISILKSFQALLDPKWFVFFKEVILNSCQMPVAKTS